MWHTVCVFVLLSIQLREGLVANKLKSCIPHLISPFSVTLNTVPYKYDMPTYGVLHIDVTAAIMPNRSSAEGNH